MNEGERKREREREREGERRMVEQKDWRKRVKEKLK